jgi:hypothetical protein
MANCLELIDFSSKKTYIVQVKYEYWLWLGEAPVKDSPILTELSSRKQSSSYKPKTGAV